MLEAVFTEFFEFVCFL